MNLTLHQMDAQSIHQVDQFDRNSIVNSKLVLNLEEGRLTYSIVPVAPYEKKLSVEARDYTTFLDNPRKAIFFTDVDRASAGQIKLMPWWNQFAYIEELAVNQEFRGRGIGFALMRRAIEWARQQKFPGMMLETQDNNVRACLLYKRCGFELCGFDTHLYKASDPGTDEIALFWYLIF